MGSTLLPASIESLATASYSLFDEVEGCSGEAIAAPATVYTFPINSSQLKPQYQHTVINRYSTPAARWAALTTRDPAASKAFIYAVRTTKIYCRPDCRARLARRANVAFYDNIQQAQQDGYRACKRCKPDSTVRPVVAAIASSNTNENEQFIMADASDQTQEELTDPEDVRTKIQHAVRVIRQSASQGSKLSLSQLSKEVGLSKWHLHRVFKQLQGMTPREMAERIRNSHGSNIVPATPADDLPVLEGGSDWIDFGSDHHEESATNAIFQMHPPLTPLLSTPSTDNALTPTTWADDISYDPMLFTTDEIKGQEMNMEVLLSDLFPELYGGYDLNLEG
jgi:methylphosphotriester-DNA--protein-cysteine methyltransferase